jgi:hypothetical protein
MSAIHDPLVVMVAVFIMAVLSVIVLTVVFTIGETDAFQKPSIKNDVDNLMNSFKLLDYMAGIGLICFILTTILLAWLIPTHPIFWIFFLIQGFATFLITPFFTHAFKVFIESSSFTSIVDYFPLTQGIMSVLPLASLASTFVLLYVSYTRHSNYESGLR